MKVPKRDEANRLKAIVQAAPEKCMVLVTAENAHHFKTVPQDGRTYFVQDPRRPWVYHVTYPSGESIRMDDRKPPPNWCITTSALRNDEKRIQRHKRHAKKGASRTADKLSVGLTIQRQTDDPPVVCLIDINRVMRICGFKKSFIYEQLDFPTPVRFGTSRRSSVRWVESEIIFWVNELTSKRISSEACRMQATLCSVA